MKRAFVLGQEAKLEAVASLNAAIGFLQTLLEDLRADTEAVNGFLLGELAAFEERVRSEEAEFSALLESANRLHLAARSSREGDSTTSVFIGTAAEGEDLAASPAPPPENEVVPHRSFAPRGNSTSSFFRPTKAIPSSLALRRRCSSWP